MSTYYQKVITDQLLKIEKLQNKMKALSCRDNIMGCEEELLSVVRQEETLCLQMRNLIRDCCVESIDDFDNRIQNLLDITIKETDNGFAITLPALRHRKRSRENTVYITTPLFMAVNRFVEQHPVKPFEKARVTICHCYMPDAPKTALPDYDNIEIKKVLDVLAIHFLIDDNITRYELLHTSRKAEKAYTEITIKHMSENGEKTPDFKVGK